MFFPLALVLLKTYVNRKNLVKLIGPGTLIIVSWLIFSVIYFGTPLPNTFYAKLSSGLPQSEFFLRGLGYYASLILDINSIIILCLGLISILIYRDRLTIAIFVGKIFYLIYILYVGGGPHARSFSFHQLFFYLFVKLLSR